MGAWGKGNWENDDALDWLGDLSDPAELADAFATCQRDDPDTGDCCVCLAAAEVVAAAFGKAGPGFPQHGEDWVRAHGKNLDLSLVPKAMEAVVRIGDESELQELFDEGGRDNEWHAVLEELLQRLRTVSNVAG